MLGTSGSSLGVRRAVPLLDPHQRGRQTLRSRPGRGFTVARGHRQSQSTNYCIYQEANAVPHEGQRLGGISELGCREYLPYIPEEIPQVVGQVQEVLQFLAELSRRRGIDETKSSGIQRNHHLW